MADPFNLFAGSDTKTSSTIDDDFDALFGPICGGVSTEVTDDNEENRLDDFFKPSPAAKKARTDPTNPVPEGKVSLIDFGDDTVTPESTEETSSRTTDTDGSTTKLLNLNKDKLFSFDNVDPGLDDVMSIPKSSNVENQSVFNDTHLQQQQQSPGFSKANTASNDLFDSLFATKSNKKQISEITNSLDDIFAPSSSNKPQTEESLTDLFGPKNKLTNKQESGGALGDIFGQSSSSSLAEIPDEDFDIFASTKPIANKDEPSKPNSSSKGENWLENYLTKQEKTAGEGDDSIFEYASQPASQPEDSGSKDGTRRNEKSDLSADLLAELPTPRTDTCRATSSHSDTSAHKEDINVFVAPAFIASGDVMDAKGAPVEMDTQPEEVAGGAQSHTVPDILDFLGDDSPDLPDISTLESDNTHAVEQLDLINHQSSADDGEVASDKRDHSTESEPLKDEVGDVEPTKPQKKKEDDDDKCDSDGDTAPATGSADTVKLSVTAPSFDLGDGGEPIMKTGPKEEIDESTVFAKLKDSEKIEKSKKLKEEINKDSEFMDFSVLSIPEESQLNVDISKHKRSLSKKGSLALRKRPSRRAIRSSGSDGDDTLFQDSTEPKPKVPSDDGDCDDDIKEDEKREDVFEAGRGDPALPIGGNVGRGPFKPPMTGGVKIPGLLEGLKKSKSFKSPTELKKTDIDNTKKSPEKEEVNFRSLLKSTSSSTTSPSKSFKESQNQNIAQTSPSSVKPSDLRRQPMAGSIKLPALIKPSSPSDTPSKQPPALSSRVPPPVASKPKPSLPSAKPRLSPIVKSEQTSKPSSAASPYSSSSSPSSSSSFFEKMKTNEKGPNSVSAISSPSSKNTTNATAASFSFNDTSYSTVKHSTTSATSTIATTSTTTASSSSSSSSSSPSSILSSIRPKPYTPPKPKPQPRPSPATKSSTPLSLDAKLSPNTTKVDTTQTDEDDADKMSSTKITDRVDILEIASKTRSSSSSSSFENGQDMTDAGVLKPRKSSISGVSSVQSPSGPDRSAPRKSSISGSAYAPMGFKRSISNEGSDKSDDKPEPRDEGSITSLSKTRTSSIAESSEKEKDEEDKEKIESEMEKGEKTNGSIDKVIQVEDKEGLKPKRTLQKDNRLSERDGDNPSSNSNKPDTPQKPVWGVQLRKVDKKPLTPSKPSVDQSKEVESPANWRQQLANKRKSITPKDPSPSKGPEPTVPEWAKASSERRKRLMESGVIKSEAK